MEIHKKKNLTKKKNWKAQSCEVLWAGKTRATLLAPGKIDSCNRKDGHIEHYTEIDANWAGKKQ